MAQKVYVEPVKYVVGVDITEAQYHEAIQKIGDWFHKKRKVDEPNVAARLAFQECLDGITDAGEKWFAAATWTLNSRVRSKCHFDLVTMSPLETASDKQKAKKAREKELAQRKKEKAREDSHVPAVIRKEGIIYGQDSNTLYSSAELRRWKEVRAGYLREFPHLDSINSQAELDQLCDLVIRGERQRMNVLSGQKNTAGVDMSNIVEELSKLKKALGIHPDQLKNKVQQKLETSIGAAAEALDTLGSKRELRQRFFIEQMLQYFQMFHSPAADGLGYQLDEIGLFGLTKCRTCHCAKCGMRNFVGISIDEVEGYLVEQGALVQIGTTEPPPKPPESTPGGDREAIDIDFAPEVEQ